MIEISVLYISSGGSSSGGSSSSSMEARENGGFGRGSRFTEDFDGTCADICAPPHM